MLDWALVNGITNYDVEFDTAATFNSTQHLYQTISTSTSSYNTSNLLFATKYYWRIRAHHVTDTTSWSPVWNFTTTDGKPVHVSPANGATGISLNPTIDWNLVTGVRSPISMNIRWIQILPVRLLWEQERPLRQDW